MKLDLTNQQFGRWLVLELAREIPRPGGGPYRFWLCRCDCSGVIKEVSQHTLLRGSSRSCGCLQKELARKRRTVHGRSKESEYVSWAAMMKRCFKPSHINFDRYGGRGIKVDPSWMSYDNFLADMGRKPTPRHTLERIDPNGDYIPSNTRWATYLEQNNNRTNHAYPVDTYRPLC